MELFSQGTAMTVHIYSKIFLTGIVLLLSCVLGCAVLDTAR